MKNTTKLATLALTMTLLQGCVGEIVQITTRELATAIFTDVAADKIRTSFSEDDFGIIDQSLKGKNAIYVSSAIEHDNFETANGLSESWSKRICDEFEDATKSLKKQYRCYIVASEDSTKKLTINYGSPSQDGVLLEVGDVVFLGIFSGSQYALTYTDLSSNKIIKFNSPGLFKQKQFIKYSAEYLSRLAQKANE